VLLAKVGRMFVLQNGAGAVHFVVGAWMHRDGRASIAHAVGKLIRVGIVACLVEDGMKVERSLVS
jgi:hypothetical protein